MARLDRNYQWYGKPTADKTHETERASAGQLIAVKRSLQAEWNVKEWKHGLTLKIKKKGMREAYTMISVYNNDRRNWCKCIDKLNSEIEKYEDKRDRLIVAGDLNARIGVEQEVAECGTLLEIKILKRRLEDRVVRNEGRRLFKWCEEKAWLLMNGRRRETRKGRSLAWDMAKGWDQLWI